MNLVSMRRTLGALAVGLICLYGVTAAAQAQQPAAGEQAEMSEKVYKNIQVLRGIPADQFLETMGMMAASTGLNCTHCHGGYDYNVGTYASDDIELKLTARKMIVIMNTINQSFFGGPPGGDVLDLSPGRADSACHGESAGAVQPDPSL